MPKRLRPNLFSLATSELSQDAFLAWLLSWGDNRYAETNEHLHQCSRKLIDALLKAAGVAVPSDYGAVKVRRQLNSIDVVAFLDAGPVILIEDKVDSKQHSGQLQRYRDRLAEQYGDENVACVYFKTGDQSNYEDVRDAGFAVFDRSQVLTILGECRQAGIRNAIVDDYYEHLQEIEDEFGSYRTHVKGETWPSRAWQGFFEEVKREIGKGNWDYVNNSSGGFWGLYWGWHQLPTSPTEAFIQLEYEALCFKVYTDAKDKSLRSQVRNDWHRAIMEAAGGSSLKVVRPSRFGSGHSMTVALIPEYRVHSEDGFLDIDRTLETIRTAERIHVSACDRTVVGSG